MDQRRNRLRVVNDKRLTLKALLAAGDLTRHLVNVGKVLLGRGSEHHRLRRGRNHRQKMVLISDRLRQLVRNSHAHQEVVILKRIDQRRNLAHIFETGLPALTGERIKDKRRV